MTQSSPDFRVVVRDRSPRRVYNQQARPFRGRSPVRSHSTQRNRSPAPRPERREVEFYFHYWFGDNAQNCNRRNCVWRNRRGRDRLELASISGYKMIVTCRKSGRRFLIDTGSEKSILSAKSCRSNVVNKTNMRLYAANGSEIKIIGTKRESVDLELGRMHSWNYYCAIHLIVK
ncbi:hypothetical protein RDWZM_002129 [Blomia tropicalis]|uniref:Peptidase A2 domain-containing protein n=1 Tax=Blomia tropicalis TaxID=40697 RepID=A0A9Q0RR88_BLOTA|nr:hypothetical protein RDWZM_002129 [Blomia tropicalis]